jgi:hypothetical protein
MAAAFKAASAASPEAAPLQTVRQKVAATPVEQVPDPRGPKPLVQSPAPAPGLGKTMEVETVKVEVETTKIDPETFAESAPPLQRGFGMKVAKAIIVENLKRFFNRIKVYLMIAAVCILTGIAAVIGFAVMAAGSHKTTTVQLHKGLENGGVWSNWRFQSDTDKRTTLDISGDGKLIDVTTRSRGKNYSLGSKGWREE